MLAIRLQDKPCRYRHLKAQVMMERESMREKKMNQTS
jgi:hypothetical protein